MVNVVLDSVVVSTVASAVLFARFPTVDCITKVSSFLQRRHSCSKKVPVEKKNELSRVGVITYIALLH